jgi:hypothetical protein
VISAGYGFRRSVKTAFTFKVADDSSTSTLKAVLLPELKEIE